MPAVFQLVPTELAEHILTFCHPREVARVAQTCKQLHSLVYDGTDQYLWRELFLLYPFDDLRKAVPAGPGEIDATVDWRGELQRRIFAEAVVVSDPATASADELLFALSTLVSVVYSSLPHQPLLPGQDNPIRSGNLTWLHDVLQRSPFIRTPDLALTEPTEQLCCQLRSQLSLTMDDGTDTSELSQRRAESRCAVYNLSNYTIKNLWGPYLPMFTLAASPGAQPKVDWKQVEHVMNVVVLNMRELVGTPYSLMRPQLGLEHTRAYSAPGTAALRTNGSKDWAGLEGLWRRFVCFMDYRELFAFNYSNLDTSLSPRYFVEDSFTEAVRILEMRIFLKKVEEPTPFDYPECPQLVFEGHVKGLQSRNADVKGFVQRFLDGTIRWKFETIYDGVPQWSGECIQVGNICSTIGLAGIWSGVQHTAGDPAGPFWMWKTAESVVERDIIIM
ncbi:hypothetical protein EUX98_g5910 [Antrodiella citrinella]|uniref:F-box domain-containing protein n=1 Tax=Antrodiella citrinella TaxID=2447956 RepID=A0A4S4MY12_9APHY|nr:hypothetical protein EUX98_g5910 [Antrodiella citrinella]